MTAVQERCPDITPSRPTSAKDGACTNATRHLDLDPKCLGHNLRRTVRVSVKSLGVGVGLLVEKKMQQMCSLGKEGNRCIVLAKNRL